jgi:hypothetical protein
MRHGALRTKDLARVTADTTVQPKDITFRTDAKLLHAAIKGLTRLARKRGVRLRQSYVRIAKRSGRYAHAKHFNRHRRQLRILRTRLGRLIRNIRARSQATQNSRRYSPGHSRVPIRSARSSSASAAGSCIRSTLRRWSASARGKASAPSNSV